MRTGGKYDRINHTSDGHASWRNDNFIFNNDE